MFILWIKNRGLKKIHPFAKKEYEKQEKGES